MDRLLRALLAAAAAVSVQAAPFSQNQDTLAILAVGTGSAALGTTGTAGFVVEINATTGATVRAGWERRGTQAACKQGSPAT
jgi:hypothetical protein